MMCDLFHALRKMYEEYGDMENYIRSYANLQKESKKTDAITAIEAICDHFFLNMKQSESYPKTRIQAVNVYVCSYDGWFEPTLQ